LSESNIMVIALVLNLNVNSVRTRKQKAILSVFSYRYKTILV